MTAVEGELRRRTVRGLLWSAAESWGAQAVSVLVFIVLSRYLAPAAFGLLGMAAVFVALVQTLVGQGMSDALVQRERLDNAHRDTAFWTALVTGAVLTAAGWAVAGSVAAFYREPTLAPVVAWLSVIVLVRSLATTQSALLRRALEFRPLALRSLGGALAGGIVGVVMAVAGYGVWALVGQQLATAVVATALLWFASDWRPGLGVSWQCVGDLFPFGARVVGSNLVNFLNRHTDDLFIGLYLGATALGFYAVGYRLLLAATAILTGFSSAVAFPVFSRLQGEPERLRNGLYQATGLTAMLAFPTFVGAAVLAPDLITVLFGARWLEAAPVMRVLAFIGILHAVFYLTSNAFYAVGEAATVLWLNVLNAVTNVAAFWIAARWGIVVVAAAYVLRGYLLAPLRLTLLRRAVGIEVGRYLRELRAPALATTLMAGSILGALALLPTAAVARLLVGVPLGVLVYLAALRMLDPAGLRQVVALGREALAAPAPPSTDPADT